MSIQTINTPPTKTQKPLIAVQYLEHYRDLPKPAYETPGAAGMDLRAAVAEDLPVAIKPRERVMIPTGMAIALPDGFEAQVRPRSGLAWKQGLTVLNSPGTIDADYRGEVKVILVNLGKDPVVIRRGDRIAQLVIAPVVQAELMTATVLPGTSRGAGGFGSTGV
jgi:dUTP pyrophosphatase